MFIDGSLQEKDVLIEGNKISRIGSGLSADERIDVRGKIVIPGVIDPHVHFREPGHSHKEDFRSGSFAAASSGVTTVLEMPNTSPPTTTVKALEDKRLLAASKSVVNFGFHFGFDGRNYNAVSRVKNTASVKVFLGASTGMMKVAFETVPELLYSSRMVSFHAEGDDIRRVMQARGLAGRYFCHVTSKNELDYLRIKPAKTYIEVTPHHLFLTRKDETRLVRMKPPLREQNDRDSLWRALNTGIIDTVGSDHAPHLVSEKESGDVWGVPGIETSLPLMLDAVNRNRVNLPRLVGLMCSNPAEIFGIVNRGLISPGCYADLTVIDMNMEKKVRCDRLFSKCGWSPFEGRSLRGWPVMTIINGETVWDGETLNRRNRGKEVVFGGGWHGNV